jgi:type IX secretion system PorP/SprF family membrane protein
MRVKRDLLMFAIPLLLGLSARGQDLHFSQYYSSPLNLNPSLTGQFDGDYRLVGNYRNQWKSITIPYRTYSFSADARQLFKHQNFHAGIVAFSDDAGDSNFGTVQVGISGAYSYALTPDSMHALTFGIQPSFAQRNLNYTDLTFDNQYSTQQGRFDASLSNRENFQGSGFSYFNLATGLSWDYRISKTTKTTTGISVHNLTKPKQSLFSDQDIRLNRRMTVHTNGQFRAWPQIDLLPGFSLMKQGSYREIVFGSSARYLLNGLTNLHIGYWYRNQDAGYITAGITHQNVYMGFSYDMNTSDLKPASNGRGGVEFSIIYIIRKFDGRLVKYKACPNYL